MSLARVGIRMAESLFGPGRVSRRSRARAVGDALRRPLVAVRTSSRARYVERSVGRITVFSTGPITVAARRLDAFGHRSSTVRELLVAICRRGPGFQIVASLRATRPVHYVGSAATTDPAHLLLPSGDQQPSRSPTGRTRPQDTWSSRDPTRPGAKAQRLIDGQMQAGGVSKATTRQRQPAADPALDDGVNTTDFDDVYVRAHGPGNSPPRRRATTRLVTAPSS